MSRVLLVMFVVAGADAGSDAKSSRVVVFKKGVTAERAEACLKKLGFPFHSGSDSSRGKAYFYENGPQYLVDVPAAEQARYAAAVKKVPEVHESWVADWTTQKD